MINKDKVYNTAHETNLIERIKAGEKELFQVLIKPYLTKIKRKINISQHYDKEDVLQDVLLKVFSNINQFSFKSKFSSWLYIIVLNEIRSAYRKSLNNSKALTAYSNYVIEQSYYNDYSYESREKLARVLLKIETLDPKYKRVFTLSSEGLSIAEIAAIEGITESNCKTRIFRARNILRKE